jgi:hypothetical protein
MNVDRRYTAGGWAGGWVRQPRIYPAGAVRSRVPFAVLPTKLHLLPLRHRVLGNYGVSERQWRVFPEPWFRHVVSALRPDARVRRWGALGSQRRC